MLGPKKLCTKKIWVQKKILDPQKFWVNKKFGVREQILGLKIFLVKKISWSKKFWPEKNRWSKKNLVHEIFENLGLKKILGLKKYWV